MTSKIFI